jgi:hypothetical protein
MLKKILLATLAAGALAAPAFADDWRYHAPPRPYDYHAFGGGGYGEGGWRNHDDAEGEGRYHQREERIAQWIRTGYQQGWLQPWEARRAFQNLRATHMWIDRELQVHDGELPPYDARRADWQLDRLAGWLRGLHDRRAGGEGYEGRY